MPEPVGHGLERFVLCRLPGGSEGRESATVEAAQCTHNHVPAASTELARQLDGGLVGLGAAVAHEDLTR